MDALLADRKDGWGVLREHVGRYPESKISPLVKNEFLRLGIGIMKAFLNFLLMCVVSFGPPVAISWASG